MPVLENIGRLATGRPDGAPDVLHTIDDAALVWEADTIQWVGPEADLPSRVRNQHTVDAEGHLVVPGLIDGHTHLAFGGWRADEFAMRIQGASYLDIARQGGGIRRTVEQTRRASEDELVRLGMERLDAMAALGVTTVEAKSGYGLTVEDELKTLRVYRRLQKKHPLTVVPTFLGAHTVPPEYDDDRDGYIDLICETMIPRVAAATLAEFCDVFVEETAFSPDEARRIFATAHKHGLRPKLHADQLTDTGGAALAAAVDAASADHLEMISDDGIAALAASDTVAVSLPLATLYLNQDPLPARRLLDAGVPVAVATDFNPGSAPSYHLPVAMTLACTMQRMTPAEVLTGATRSAAQALDRADRLGTLAPGMQADFVLVDAPSVDHWLYHLRPNAAVATYVQGTRVSS
jgi:imidazolonepropionase